MPDRNEELLKQKNPWSKNDNPIWIASNISLRRNVEKFKFPAKMDGNRRKQIVTLLSKEILASPLLKKPFLLRAEEVGPLEKEFLLEHMLSSEIFQSAHQGEAFVIDETGQFLSSLNIKDHLHIQEIDIKGEIEGAWSRLAQLETEVGQKIAYAYNSQFGFLTAEPLECGTGLRASLYLQLSALRHSGKLQGVLGEHKDDHVQTQNFLGSPEPLVGDIVVLTNNFTLGLNEETILSSLRNFATKLLHRETLARQEIREANGSPSTIEIKDRVSRAYGILVHSYQIEAQEALNAIALLKLGCDLGWIGGTSLASLNELFFNCRRAHLLRLFSEKISQDQIPHKRAEFIHHSLQGVELLAK